MTIPSDIAAKVLFLADRTCCVCHEEGKPVQIHHIDGNNANSTYQNLAVLCLDCHTATQIQGGFHRKLDAEQVLLYRDDWLSRVARERAMDLTHEPAARETEASDEEITFVTSVADSLRENKQYQALAMYYSIWGNTELRDKYIEKVLASKREIPVETEIFLRGLQGKADQVDPARVQEEIARKKKNNHFSQLARLYRDVGRPIEAVKAYCQTVLQSLDGGGLFSAAYYLKELSAEKLFDPIFELAFRERTEKGDLWWQVRCLQELGWDGQLKELMVSKRAEIEKSGNPYLLVELYSALGEKAEYNKARKAIILGTRMVRRGKRSKRKKGPNGT